MAHGLRHSDWHLVSEQKFRRRALVEESLQVFRGQPYVVLSDKIAGSNMRLSEKARQVWDRLDGRKTAQQVWEELSNTLAVAPTQGEFVDWIMQLVAAGMILSDHDLDPAALSRRTLKRRSATIEQRAASPLAIKIKLFDPSWIIKTTYPFFAPLFSKFGVILLISVFLIAVLAAVVNFDRLISSIDNDILSQSSILSLAIAYPILKAVHELSHGYAVHRFGGEVREFGIMLLIFFPVPYVEASEATAFSDKRARMLVSGAGIFAEVIIAALALIIWVNLEPGLIRAILFNFIVVGSISTVLFNGNPLLKFDAYYVLSDWLELPNLAQRSGQYLGDQFLARIIGLRGEITLSRDEARILGVYGVLSLGYRLFLSVTIAIVVSQLFFVFGLLLAIWAIISSTIWPLIKLVRRGARMAKSQNRQIAATIRLVLFLMAVSGFAFFVPLPFFAPGEGKIHVRPDAYVVAESSGNVTDFRSIDEPEINRGDLIVGLENLNMETRYQMLRLNEQSLRVRLDRGGATVEERRALERQLNVANLAVLEAEGERASLSVVAKSDGDWSWLNGQPPVLGAYVSRGDRLGFIARPDKVEIVLSFPPGFAGIIPENAFVDVRLPNGTAFRDSISQSQLIDAGQQVPVSILARSGGPVPEDRNSPGTALNAVWLAWIAPEQDLLDKIGSRVLAKIELPSATLAEQLNFHIKRLFLRAFEF